MIDDKRAARKGRFDASPEYGFFAKSWVDLRNNPDVVNCIFPKAPVSHEERGIPAIVKPEVDVEVLTHVDPHTLADSFVYVHCYFRNKWENMLIRIWTSTFLIDTFSGTRSKLVHAENITMAPMWTQIPDGAVYSFLLIFSGLPKSCQQFDLVEEIPEPGGFLIKNISRNETDVYHIDVSA